MGLLDFIVKPAEDVINAIEGGANKTHAKQNGAVSQAASIAANGGNPLSVLQTPPPLAQPAPNVTTINGNSPMPSITSSPTDTQSAQATPQTTMPLEQKSVNTANAVANSPGGRFVQGVQTGASTNYDPIAYENQKGANSPEEYGTIVGSALPALGMADNPLQGMDMALPAINQGKAGVNAAIDETKANVAANGGAEAGFVGFGKKATQEPVTPQGSPVQLKNSDLYKQYGVKTPARKAEIQKTLDTEVSGTTAPEVFDNLHPTIENLGQQIDAETAGNTSTASKLHPNGVTYQDLADGMQAKAQAQGLMKTPEGRAAVNKAIAQQINHISQNADAINNGSAATSFSTPVFNDDLTPVTSRGVPSTNQTQYRRVGGAPAGTAGPKGPFREMPVKNSEQPDLSAQPTSSYNPEQMASANEADISKAGQPLDMPTLRSEYKAANTDRSALLQRRNSVNARPLTDAESAQLLYRDVLKDKIGATNPRVMDLISKQHDLYDASDGVLRASNEYEKAQEKAAEDAANANNQPKQSFLQKAKNPLEVGALGTGILGGLAWTLDQPVVKGGLVAGEQAIQNAFDNKKGQGTTGQGNGYQYSQRTDNHYYANQSHISSDSIPQTQAQVKPDQYGNWPVANPQNIYDKYGNPVAMNKSFHDNQKATLDKQLAKDTALYGDKSLQVANDTGALATLEDLYNGAPAMQSDYNTASNISSLVATVKAESKSLPNSLLQSTTFDQLSSINGGQYNQLHSDIVSLAKAYGVDPSVIWKQQTNDALLGTLDSMGRQNAAKWNLIVNGKTGNTGASNLSNQQVTNGGQITGNSPMPAIKPQGKVQIYNGGGNTPLPAIPNFQQIGSQFAQ